MRKETISNGTSPLPKAKFPPQIKYIVGNEAAERFSFYGMRAILVVFMIQYLLMPESESKGLYHLFVSACYFTPLLGGYLADRYWGKYKTIMLLSLFYCAGHAALALFDGKPGMYAGLALIAFGAGGIKPCVSANVGDQFTKENSHLIKKVFDLFYFAINFGAFFSTLLIPKVLSVYGHRWAFGIPGILMGIATLVFWMGRKQYVYVPPTGKQNAMHFVPIVLHCLARIGSRKGAHWLDCAREKFREDQVEGAKAAVAVLKVFVLVAMFWSLYDQTASTWVIQAQRMDRAVLGHVIEAAQMQALNPIFIMIMIPIFSLGLYPLVEKMGVRVTSLRKMGCGMILIAVSFVWAGFLQIAIDAGQSVNIAWQFFPYLLLTAAEILVSITGLEFAYTQAPKEMKSTLMSFWLLTIMAGNMLTAVISYLNKFPGALEFFFYATVMGVVSLIFVWVATNYKERNYLVS
ncbi:MAG: POT family MFS transporter [Deltaproteobacteria bacterium]|nr:POT family MFS transporter [Deltaproteobacteria bacterium]